MLSFSYYSAVNNYAYCFNSKFKLCAFETLRLEKLTNFDFESLTA